MRNTSRNTNDCILINSSKNCYFKLNDYDELMKSKGIFVNFNSHDESLIEKHGRDNKYNS